MKMFSTLIILGLTPFFSGCVYVNTEMPGKVQSVTQFELKSGDYQVIQRVYASGETTLWFGMVLLGEKVIRLFWKKLRPSEEIPSWTILSTWNKPRYFCLFIRELSGKRLEWQ